MNNATRFESIPILIKSLRKFTSLQAVPGWLNLTTGWDEKVLVALRAGNDLGSMIISVDGFAARALDLDHLGVWTLHQTFEFAL